MIRSHSLTFYVVRCDFCGDQNRIVADGFSSENDAETHALNRGWYSPSGNHHLCPSCAAPFVEVP